MLDFYSFIFHSIIYFFIIWLFQNMKYNATKFCQVYCPCSPPPIVGPLGWVFLVLFFVLLLLFLLIIILPILRLRWPLMMSARPIPADMKPARIPNASDLQDESGHYLCNTFNNFFIFLSLLFVHTSVRMIFFSII